MHCIYFCDLFFFRMKKECKKNIEWRRARIEKIKGYILFHEEKVRLAKDDLNRQLGKLAADEDMLAGINLTYNEVPSDHL